MKELLLLLLFSPLILFLVRLSINWMNYQNITNFRIAVLSTLAEHGETMGRELRVLANESAGTKIGIVNFYAIMTQLEEQGSVTSRYEHRELHGVEIRVLLYKITPKGRRKRLELNQKKEKLPGILGNPEPRTT